MHQLF